MDIFHYYHKNRRKKSCKRLIAKTFTTLYKIFKLNLFTIVLYVILYYYFHLHFFNSCIKYEKSYFEFLKKLKI